MSQIINEAFKELKGLDEATFSFDKQGVMELRDFLHQSYEEPTFIDVVDPAAETAEEVKDSYEGDVILQCCVCDAYITKSPKDVFIDKATGRANVDEVCPSCWNTGGFTIVSQVKDPYAEDEEVTCVATDEIEDDPDLEIATDEITVEDKDADVEDEPLTEAKDDEDEVDPYGATFVVYELDEDGEEVERIETFEEDEEEKAIEFAKAQPFPTHIVYVPNVDPDEDPTLPIISTTKRKVAVTVHLRLFGNLLKKMSHLQRRKRKRTSGQSFTANWPMTAVRSWLLMELPA